MNYGYTTLVNVQVVENNVGHLWKFIDAKIEAPGMDGQRAMWATASLDLDKEPTLLAAVTMGARFSLWDCPAFSLGFQSQLEDETEAARMCAGDWGKFTAKEENRLRGREIGCPGIAVQF